MNCSQIAGDCGGKGFKVMKDPEQAVRMKLLESAKKEFLERGYEKASLRSISAGAGVTTGAVYFFFQNKEDLFAQVVEKTLKQLEALSAEMIREELENADAGVDNERRLLEFFWKNREVMEILMDKSAGTGYAGFAEEMGERLEKAFAVFFKRYGIEAPDEQLIHILVQMKMQGYRQLIAGNDSLERTMELAEMIGWYVEGGFESLMKELNRRM